MRSLFFIVCCLIIQQGFTQTIRKENLSKKQYFFYDSAKSQVESEGYFYKDGLGETTLRHGKWKFYDREGDLAEERTYYKNNLHGPTIVYFTNGVKASEGFFHLGLQDSSYVERFENDSLKQTGFYKEGKPAGVWTYYYRDGRKKMVEEIMDGASYVWEFYLPDSLHTQTIIDGNGFLEIFYTNGNLKESYRYKNGMKDGEFGEASIYGYYLLRGTFKENKPHGQWKYFYYTGHLEKIAHYDEGVLHGDYELYYDNEQLTAKGRYNQGKKEGRWTWYTNAGVIDMQGDFVDGLQDGDWVYNYPTGELSYKAQYALGKRSGFWEYFYKDGSRFKEGSFLEDQKHGAWKTWYESGQLLMQGDYVHDKEEGVWENYWENGKLKNKTTFKAGELHGAWFSYFPSGKLKTSGNYDKGLKSGEWKDHFDNGRLKDIENYKIVSEKSKIKYGPMKDREHRKSVKHGEFVSFSSKDFDKTQAGTFKNGEKNGEWIAYHPGGKYPAVIMTYKNGKLDGPMRTYSHRGNKLLSEVNYKDGLQHGKAIVYDKKGNIAKEVEYKNGMRVVQGGFVPGK